MEDGGGGGERYFWRSNEAMGADADCEEGETAS